MERLTTREEYPHGAEGVSKDRLTGKYCRGTFEATACVERLAEYENAEADGRLLELPCRVGDIVWYLQEQYSGKWIAKPATVSSFQFDRFLRIYCIEERQNTQAFWEKDFGKSVFLTKEAAEAALKEMEEQA